MTKLTWDEDLFKKFEFGLDRAVIYLDNERVVSWSGLTSVSNKQNTSSEPIYYDGIKVNDKISYSEFSGVIKAYTYPDELLELEGLVEDSKGVYVTGQPSKRFNLSWRTKIFDSNAEEIGYQIHIVYNAILIPQETVYRSTSNIPDLLEFQWNIFSIPEEVVNLKPASYIVLDSLRIDNQLLLDIEDILYGTEELAPRLPSLKSFLTFIKTWERIIIINNGDGTWTASSVLDDDIIMLDDTTFQINNANAIFLDIDTYEITSSDKNEELIWQP